MRLLAVVVLTGCNAILGIDETKPVRCDLGSFVPTFSSAATTVVGGCDSYVPSDTVDLATAHCGTAIRESAIDASEMVDTTVPPPADSPRLAPDGQTLYVRSGLSFFAYSRSAGMWTDGSMQTFDVGTHAGDVLSTPSDAPDRRVVLATQSGFTELDEASVGQWQTRHAYAAADFGATAILDPSLSPDARRLVFMAQTIDDTTPHVYIAIRADPAEMFGTGRRIDGTPPGAILSAPYLTADCDRLYFTQGGTVFYVAR